MAKNPPQPASRKQADVKTAAKRTRGALEALTKLDPWTVAEAIRRGIGFASDAPPAPPANDLTSRKWQGPSRHEALVEATAIAMGDEGRAAALAASNFADFLPRVVAAEQPAGCI